MIDDAVPPSQRPARGGRLAALAQLDRVRPAAYARTRNFLDGAVTRLSPYLRHGILTLAEVRDAAQRRAPNTHLEKFVAELAWRDYYLRVHRVLGDRIWDDVEPYKTGWASADYSDELPKDIAEGRTGLACMDGFVRDLRETGYVHNHARMWFASYVVHTRRIAWQAGARFYLAHLLDGDPASNNLSWQWVASTFAHKPYIFDRANLARYTNDAYCARCPLRANGCPFDASYRQLDATLFPNGQHAADDFERPDLHVGADAEPDALALANDAIVWQHEESLSPNDPARAAAPGAPVVFVWDDRARARDPWSPLRVRFVEETLDELPRTTVARGDAVAEILRFARAHAATCVVTTAAIDPRLREIEAALRGDIAVIALAAPRLVTLARETNLGRFSRYWQRAKATAFGPAAAP
jgi:deoxyribodipyrimidine photo-lyase